MKAIARLFADMGDSYVELIATGIEYSYLLSFKDIACSILCLACTLICKLLLFR